MRLGGPDGPETRDSAACPFSLFPPPLAPASPLPPRPPPPVSPSTRNRYDAREYSLCFRLDRGIYRASRTDSHREIYVIRGIQFTAGE